MKKVILTGFEPFGHYEFNPTEESTLYFNDIGIIEGVAVLGVVLPCTYFGAFRILSKIMNKEKPDAIISTGLSSGLSGIRIETTFHNIMHSKYPDADGMMPDNVLLWNKPCARDFLIATADNINLANILDRAGIPVELSINADAFICNSLGYLTTKKILKHSSFSFPMRNMFIHVPWTDNYKGKVYLDSSKIFFEKRKFYEAIKLLIKNI